MPAVEIAVLFLVVAVIMGLLGLVALAVRRRTARPAGDGAPSASAEAPTRSSARRPPTAAGPPADPVDGATSAAAPEADLRPGPGAEAPLAPEAAAPPPATDPAAPLAPEAAAPPAPQDGVPTTSADALPPAPEEGVPPAAAAAVPPTPEPAATGPSAGPPSSGRARPAGSRRRQAPVSGLPKPLPEQTRQRYLTAWTGVQDRFEDSPVLALSQADALLGALLAERGLPSDGMRSQADLPAGTGGRVLEEFRLGHQIEQTNSTVRSDLAQVSVGMEHFRRVFEELVEQPDRPGPAGQPASTADRDSSG